MPTHTTRSNLSTIDPKRRTTATADETSRGPSSVAALRPAGKPEPEPGPDHFEKPRPHL